MARLYRCDRCKAEQPYEIQSLREANASGGYYADLCKSCLEEFARWVKLGKK